MSGSFYYWIFVQYGELFKPIEFIGYGALFPPFIDHILYIFRLLCSTINAGEALTIDSSWGSICKIECEKIMHEMAEKYEHSIKIELDDKLFNEHEVKRINA